MLPAPMSSLNSSSTIAEITAAYLDNASYEEDDDASKARAFVTACRLLLLMLPSRSRGGGSEVELDLVRIENQMQAAQSFLAVHPDGAAAGSGGGLVRYSDFTDFRD